MLLSFTMAARQAEPYDHLFKLLLVGDAAVGKSRQVFHSSVVAFGCRRLQGLVSYMVFRVILLPEGALLVLLL